MLLRCKINNEEYDICQGVPFSDEYNETLDSGTIIIDQVYKIKDLKPYDDVVIWDADYEYLGYNEDGEPLFAGYTFDSWDILSGFPRYKEGVTIFYKHLLVDAFSEDIINLSGRSDGKSIYKYKIQLFSETKGLEVVQLPNLSITEPLDANKKISIWEYMNKYIDLYSPKYKRKKKIDDNTYSETEWEFVSKYRLDPNLKDVFKDTYSPDFDLTGPNLKDILSRLMIVKDCIPCVRNNTIFAINISERKGEFNNDLEHINFITGNLGSSNYCDSLKVNYSNAIPGENSTRYTEYLGFRNYDSALMTLDNMRIETKFPIYKINKIYMCYYKKYSIVNKNNGKKEDKFFLCKQDITPLVKLDTERNLLSQDWSKFAELQSIDATVYDYAKFKMMTVGYSIGSKYISGWGTTYKYPERQIISIWDIEKTYVQNIFEKLDTDNPYGIYDDIYLLEGRSTEDYYIEFDYGISTIISPFTNDSLKLKSFVFQIDYQGFYNGAVVHSKDIGRDDIVINNNPNSGLVSLEKDGLYQKEQLNRFGNKVVTITARYDDISQLQSLGSVLNLEDEKDIIIYQREYSIYDNMILATYTGSKDYVLKNYYTSVYARHRTWSLMNYNEAVTRAENKKKFIILEKDKKYFENNYDDFFIENENNIIKTSFCEADERVQRQNIGIISHNQNAFVTDLNSFVNGDSLCFNLAMPDNVSAGMYWEVFEPYMNKDWDLTEGVKNAIGFDSLNVKQFLNFSLMRGVEGDYTGTLQNWHPLIDDSVTGHSDYMGFYVGNYKMLNDGSFNDTENNIINVERKTYNKLSKLPLLSPKIELKQAHIFEENYPDKNKTFLEENISLNEDVFADKVVNIGLLDTLQKDYDIDIKFVFKGKVHEESKYLIGGVIEEDITLKNKTNAMWTAINQIIDPNDEKDIYDARLKFKYVQIKDESSSTLGVAVKIAINEEVFIDVKKSGENSAFTFQEMYDIFGVILFIDEGLFEDHYDKIFDNIDDVYLDYNDFVANAEEQNKAGKEFVVRLMSSFPDNTWDVYANDILIDKNINIQDYGLDFSAFDSKIHNVIDNNYSGSILPYVFNNNDYIIINYSNIIKEMENLMGGKFNLQKDNKEKIDMTYQIEPITTSEDIVFSPWLMKLTDLNGSYFKRNVSQEIENSKYTKLNAVQLFATTYRKKRTWKMDVSYPVLYILMDVSYFNSININYVNFNVYYKRKNYINERLKPSYNYIYNYTIKCPMGIFLNKDAENKTFEIATSETMWRKSKAGLKAEDTTEKTRKFSCLNPDEKNGQYIFMCKLSDLHNFQESGESEPSYFRASLDSSKFISEPTKFRKEKCLQVDVDFRGKTSKSTKIKKEEKNMFLITSKNKVNKEMAYDKYQVIYDYNPNKTYSVGEIVKKDGKVYRCINSNLIKDSIFYEENKNIQVNFTSSYVRFSDNGEYKLISWLKKKAQESDGEQRRFFEDLYSPGVKSISFKGYNKMKVTWEDEENKGNFITISSSELGLVFDSNTIEPSFIEYEILEDHEGWEEMEDVYLKDNLLYNSKYHEEEWNDIGFNINDINVTETFNNELGDLNNFEKYTYKNIKFSKKIGVNCLDYNKIIKNFGVGEHEMHLSWFNGVDYIHPEKTDSGYFIDDITKEKYNINEIILKGICPTYLTHVKDKDGMYYSSYKNIDLIFEIKENNIYLKNGQVAKSISEKEQDTLFIPFKYYIDNLDYNIHYDDIHNDWDDKLFFYKNPEIKKGVISLTRKIQSNKEIWQFKGKNYEYNEIVEMGIIPNTDFAYDYPEGQKNSAIGSESIEFANGGLLEFEYDIYKKGETETFNTLLGDVVYDNEINSVQYWYANGNSLEFVFGLNITDEDKERGYLKIHTSIVVSRDKRVYDENHNIIGEVWNYADENNNKEYGKGQYFKKTIK